MKIALVSPYDFTWPGGVTVHISQLAHQFTNMGHQVQILAPHSSSRVPEDDGFVAPGKVSAHTRRRFHRKAVSLRVVAPQGEGDTQDRALRRGPPS